MPDADWIRRFPPLEALEPDVRQLLIDRSRVVSVPKGSVIFGVGKPPENLLLLLSGTVRVQEVTESGREIVLYRVSEGESCVLTTACILAFEDYSAEGIAETDVEAVTIPRDTFDAAVARSQTFRRFLFGAYSSRIMELFHVIQDIAFSRVDIRLAHKLIELSAGAPELRITHQQLAHELGTAREVVSRQLHEFQRRGWIGSERGLIRLLDREAIAQLAAESAI